ncbi:phosphatase PAP2 family protein [Selenomonas ruminantium]|uniref:Undecaprenyl-diphosphatase n=1 Tax=Selenomonas ruminantium TaxID=971 RepID=A0A1K1PH66_SELRU|nr:phosphatase PAP2 family protein [Selenomonas ruminantium]SFW47136.1 undecaprenyl-diphosphatase [Selenomonas ruminantium]
MTLDQMILLFIQDSIRCDWLTDIIRAITLMGDNGLIWLVLLLLLLIYPKTRKLGMVAGLSFLLCVGVAEVIKNLVMRPRPFLTIAELVPLVKPPQSYSFPSVHTVSSFSVAWILLWSQEGKAVRYTVFAFALLMAFSRLYVGVHYPSDVLTGMLLAFLGSYLVWRLWGRKIS